MAEFTRASVDEVLARYQVGNEKFIEALWLRDGFVSVQGAVLVGMAEEIAAANAEIERLRALLAEAHEAVSMWGAYADSYFQKKWGWQQDVENFAPFEQYYPKDHPHA